MHTTLSGDHIESYVQQFSPDQAESIRTLREIILKNAPGLIEEIDDGKWFGGLLTYTTPSGQFVFALGPRSNGYTTFHMMPFYGSKSLQEKHTQSLKKFLSGKSCIKFLHATDLPQEALVDIIANGTKQMAEIMAAFKTNKKDSSQV